MKDLRGQVQTDLRSANKDKEWKDDIAALENQIMALKRHDYVDS